MKRIFIVIIFLLFMLSGCDEQPTETKEYPDNTRNPEEMVVIPEGSFMMGCDDSSAYECKSNEMPYHEITLSEYSIDKYEVTLGQYTECIEAGACNNNDEYEIHYQTNSEYHKCNIGTMGKESYPVNCISWYGAKAYCEWKGKRLPTEAEWEKAARGTDGRQYPWGNEKVSCEYAVMYDNDYEMPGCGTWSTLPIGSRPEGASPYGIYDMTGNVWEWVKDWYGAGYYSQSPDLNPKGPGETIGSMNYKVVRGGSMETSSEYLSIFSRSYSQPYYKNKYLFGFRCAK